VKYDRISHSYDCSQIRSKALDLNLYYFIFKRNVSNLNDRISFQGLNSEPPS